MILKGRGASPGIVIGEVQVRELYDIKAINHTIYDIELEIERLSRGRERCKQKMKIENQHALGRIGEDGGRIFETYQMMLEDPEFFGEMEALIRTEKINAEWAIERVTENFVRIFEALENTYIRERAADVQDIGRRLIKELHKGETKDCPNTKREIVIVAENMMPSELIKLEKKKGIGFITERGSIHSHTTILARSLGIPSVIGVVDLMKKVKTGDKIAFDGETGEILINPLQEELNAYQKKQKRQNKIYQELRQFKGKKSITKDGQNIEILANIDSLEEIKVLEENDGDGIGLFRTEFLCINEGRLLTEEEQFDVYKHAVMNMGGKPTIIRTLDIGGDKELPGYIFSKESNPFLGYRGIRISLDKVEVFKAQLRAILRASKFGKVKIIFPMISALEELRQAKKVLEEVKKELEEKNIDFDPKIEIGMMVEVPAAAIMSDLFAKEVDFFSIGTNDLLQYTVAVDRMNSEISHLYNVYHPALLKLIKQVVENGHRYGIQVGVCGEVAGMPELIPILVGMGVDELSMSPNSILKARWMVQQTSKYEIEKLVEKILTLSTGEEVEKCISESIKMNEEGE